MKTLREQLEDVAIRRVGPEWFKAVGHVSACRSLLAKAFVDNWPRDHFHSRVILRFNELLNESGGVPDDAPGIRA